MCSSDLGVIYRSSQLIPGAVEFIKLLRHGDLPFLFQDLDAVAEESSKHRRKAAVGDE